MNMKYNDFELLATHVRIIKEPGKKRMTFQVQVPRSPAGECIEGISSEYDAREMREHLKELDDWSKVIRLGNWLTNVLFPSTIYELLVRSLDVVQSSQEGLRIRLLLEGKLHNIPWEYILLNRGGSEATVTDLLGLMPNVSIVRHQAAMLPAWDITAELPAQMVVALASPATYPPLNLKEEQSIIEQALEENPYVNATFVSNVKLETLLPDIQHTHLFHFAGHGDFEKQMGSGPGTIEGKGVLIVDDGCGHPERVSASQVALQLRQAGVRVAVLGACQSGRRDNTNVWSSVATSLLKADLGAVVGMQDTVKDKSAIAFAKNFYRALVSGLPIDEAVISGRIAIACTDPKGWGTPVLYLRAPDGIIFPNYAENQALEEERYQFRIKVRQQVEELYGELVGVKVKVMTEGNIDVKQGLGKIGKGGKATGLEVGNMGGGLV